VGHYGILMDTWMEGKIGIQQRLLLLFQRRIL
jgi:hypothetical protein